MYKNYRFALHELQEIDLEADAERAYKYYVLGLIMIVDIVASVWF